jgi:hypothetical protein
MFQVKDSEHELSLDAMPWVSTYRSSQAETEQLTIKTKRLVTKSLITLNIHKTRAYSQATV